MNKAYSLQKVNYKSWNRITMKKNNFTQEEMFFVIQLVDGNSFFLKYSILNE